MNQLLQWHDGCPMLRHQNILPDTNFLQKPQLVLYYPLVLFELELYVHRDVYIEIHIFHYRLYLNQQLNKHHYSLQKLTQLK